MQNICYASATRSPKWDRLKDIKALSLALQIIHIEWVRAGVWQAVCAGVPVCYCYGMAFNSLIHLIRPTQFIGAPLNRNVLFN